MTWERGESSSGRTRRWVARDNESSRNTQEFTGDKKIALGPSLRACRRTAHPWIPAFAGMTEWSNAVVTGDKNHVNDPRAGEARTGVQ